MSLRSIALAAIGCAAATTLSVLPVPAAASDVTVAPDTITVRVSYADLDLATAQGRAQLDRRISGAARSICGSFFPADLEMAALVKTCREDAIGSARIPTAVASNDSSVTLTGHRVSRAAN